MKKRMLCLLLVLCIVASMLPVGFSAEALSYSGSSSYVSGKYYKQLTAVSLTGNQRQDVINVAKSQLGYYEGTNKNSLAGNGNKNSNKDFTEYGYWYGTQDKWCQMFVSWVAARANVSTSVIPKAASTVSALNFFIKKDQAYTRKQVADGKYTPQPGDIIFFKYTSAKTSHVGFVTSYSNGKVYTLEGNTNASGSTVYNCVASHSYKISNTKIVYICKPAYKGTANPFDSATIKTNVSKTKASSNSLPSGSTSFALNDKVYFNASLKNITVNKSELYVTPPGGSKTLVEKDSGSYHSYVWLASSSSGYTLDKKGTYSYVMRLYSGGYSKDFKGTFTVNGASEDSSNQPVLSRWTKYYDWNGKSTFSRNGDTLIINNSTNNHCMLGQTISVKKNTQYTVSAMVRIEGYKQGDIYPGGSSVGYMFDNQYNTETDFVTSSSWQLSKVSFNSGDKTSVVLLLSDGGFGATCNGTAYFKNIVLTEEKANDDPFSSATIKTNVSTTKATSNTLPAGGTSFDQGSTVYFNVSLKNITITKAELYINGSKTPVDTSTGSFKKYIWLGGYKLSQSGDYQYKIRLYSGSDYKDYNGKITSTSTESKDGILTASEINRAATAYKLSSTQKKALNRINTQYASKLSATQRKGTLIFMFEGCGNDSNTYGGLKSSVNTGKQRANAMCLVVKKNKIVFLDKYSSSLPSTYKASENEGNNVPTLMSGIYQFYYYNYKKTFGGYYYALKTMEGNKNVPVLRYNQKKGAFSSSTSDKIRIHKKGYSTGCQLVSSYSDFLKQVGNDGGKGIYIVDRSYAKTYLANIGYTESAINKLIK